MRIDHIGFVVADTEAYLGHLPMRQVLRTLYDPIQKAQLTLVDGGTTRIELIEPRSEESFTWNFLQKGGGWHHICYEVDNLVAAQAAMKEARMIPVRGPLPAPLLEGEVLFARNRNREMVEFLWRG
ncbi:VOC family protein [Nitratifractor sp.]|uniref:VOC family protein n=1 Tax=Nitratifractor sp. TaxID=2268144 RepID=UPI0025F39BF3|nr:VOC family protein [Nitratifractor sp.]